MTPPPRYHHPPPTTPPPRYHQPQPTCSKFPMKFVPKLRHKSVKLGRNLSKNTPIKRPVLSITGRSVMMSRTLRSNATKFLMKNVTALPNFTVSRFQRLAKKPFTRRNVPPNMTLSVQLDSRTNVNL